MKKFLTFLLAAVLVISLAACGKDDAIATVQELHGIRCYEYDLTIDFGDKSLEQAVNDAVSEDIQVSWRIGDQEDNVILSFATDENTIELYFLSTPVEERANWSYATVNGTALDSEGMEALAEMLFGTYL